MTLTKNILGTFLVGASLLLTAPLFAAELRVRIEGITEKGSIHVFVFISPDGFPKEEHAVIHHVYPVTDPAQNALDIQLVVPDSVEYAVMSYQDKDGDGKMSRFLGMIPQEPYGLSRNPQLFGKPKFSDAAIKAAIKAADSADGADSAVIVVKLHD
jgi:uncharacterized protein (DUF2141 family)